MLVIGGMPDARNALLNLLQKLDIRAIDGIAALTDDRANRLADWADVVVLWSASGLHSSVTDHFAPGRLRSTVVVVDQPGIAALLDEAMTRLPRSSATQ